MQISSYNWTLSKEKQHIETHGLIYTQKLFHELKIISSFYP